MHHEGCDKFWNTMGNTYCVIGYYLQEGSSCSNNFAPYKKHFYFSPEIRRIFGCERRAWVRFYFVEKRMNFYIC